LRIDGVQGFDGFAPITRIERGLCGGYFRRELVLDMR